MAYLRWSYSDFYAFHHVESGLTIDEQLFVIYPAGVSIELRVTYAELADSGVDGVILMIGSEFLYNLRFIHLKEDEMADDIQKALPVKHALNQYFQLWCPLWHQVLAINSAPG